jgi:hypothetical protein
MDIVCGEGRRSQQRAEIGMPSARKAVRGKQKGGTDEWTDGGKAGKKEHARKKKRKLD